MVGVGVCTDKDCDEKRAGLDELADIMSKDDLLQGIEKVDREIAQVEQQVINLKKVQVGYLVDFELNDFENIKDM